MEALEEQLAEAVRHFWITRRDQASRQGKRTGRKDYGSRPAVTGGKQIDGFIRLLSDILEQGGVPRDALHWEKWGSTTLPGYFRATKQWDLVALVDSHLVAVVEFKSQIGSYSNNVNNRAEEAVGNGVDLQTAYREGIFSPSRRPWTGYLMLLGDEPASTRTVGLQEPHFGVFPEFRNTSYADRYRILCQKLVRERLYDGACLVMSNEEHGLKGHYREPSVEIGFRAFAESLLAHSIAFAKMGRKET